MNTKTLPLSLNRNTQPHAQRTSISLSGVLTIMETIISTALTLFVGVFFVWLNGRQQEFNELEDRSS
jgi:hypothetical protein